LELELLDLELELLDLELELRDLELLEEAKTELSL
jgi:hypothetical protein